MAQDYPSAEVCFDIARPLQYHGLDCSSCFQTSPVYLDSQTLERDGLLQRELHEGSYGGSSVSSERFTTRWFLTIELIQAPVKEPDIAEWFIKEFTQNSSTMRKEENENILKGNVLSLVVGGR